MTVTLLRPFLPAVPRAEDAPPGMFSAKDLGQEPYAMGVEAACAGFRILETLCRTRQQALRQAVGAYEAAARKLRQTGGEPARLLDIHADLMNFHLEAPVQYWEHLATTGLQAQVELMARFNQLWMSPARQAREKPPGHFQDTLPARKSAAG